MGLIFHIDVNSAFLSWSAIEKLRNHPDEPDLRTIPAIIGGDEKTRHGVVLAKSIPAKRYGIQTGEPVANAYRKCPILVMEPPDHRLYHRRSRELMQLLSSYTSDIEQVSIDECYLSYTPISHRFSSPEAAARHIADEVRDTLGFTVNVGIAPNKLLAKMASDFEKPDRVHTLYAEEIPQKMWPLSVRDLLMVGKSSATRLEQLGIHTIGELACADPKFLQAQFKSHGQMMWEFANGIDRTPLHPEAREAKGIGNSTTLASDAESAEDAKRILLKLSEEVSARLREAHVLAHTVTVEIKYSDFRSCSRQTQLSTPISTNTALYQCACRLFAELWNGAPIRLLGIRTTKLQSEEDPVQLSLFDGDSPLLVPEEKSGGAAPHSSHSAAQHPSPNAALHGSSGTTDASRTAAAVDRQTHAPAPAHSGIAVQPSSVSRTPSLEKQRRLDEAMDQIRKRYGKDAITRGSLLPPRHISDKKDFLDT